MACATSTRTPWWTWTWPALALIVLGIQAILLPNVPLIIPEVFVLVATVFAAVYHAEVVAHRVGEPLGTLVLAVAVTIIEVALIVSGMITGTTDTAGLARDTVFAAASGCASGAVGNHPADHADAGRSERHLHHARPDAQFIATCFCRDSLTDPLWFLPVCADGSPSRLFSSGSWRGGITCPAPAQQRCAP